MEAHTFTCEYTLHLHILVQMKIVVGHIIMYYKPYIDLFRIHTSMCNSRTYACMRVCVHVCMHGDSYILNKKVNPSMCGHACVFVCANLDFIFAGFVQVFSSIIPMRMCVCICVCRRNMRVHFVTQLYNSHRLCFHQTHAHAYACMHARTFVRVYRDTYLTIQLQNSYRTSASIKSSSLFPCSKSSALTNTLKYVCVCMCL
jgi:hypothetical protein